jgi:hypothetical protein
VPIRCTFELELAILQAHHRRFTFGIQAEFCFRVQVVRSVVKESHSFFSLVNDAQIKENIFCCRYSLGLISTYKVDSVTNKSPNFYVTSGIKGLETCKMQVLSCNL